MSDAKLKSLADGELRRRQAISAAAKRAREGDGVIYLAEVIGTDTVKIGYTINTEKCIKRIWSDHGVRVRIIGTMKAKITQEKALHWLLRKHRDKGPVRGCATEFYHRSVVLNKHFPIELCGAI